ncbi:hypothetical protein H7J76_12530 [Mycolicibacterium fortuitum]|uniref:hypothetical protein n=1 Tax=Mycolicibacterium fortuitum TaxID=1766 RepID=UPI0021F3BECE|nr:hypothetical protein [Mycolicibacterium fortuitum]MCV7139988.1 hypothetical protein [Mycolicibacterium fortuitum]
MTAYAAKRAALRRQRAAKAGAVTVAVVIVASQAHPASRTRTAPTRRRIERAHVARARADHAKLSSLRASAFPTSAISARPFNAGAAKAEARKLTSGYRGQVKAAKAVGVSDFGDLGATVQRGRGQGRSAQAHQRLSRPGESGESDPARRSARSSVSAHTHTTATGAA